MARPTQEGASFSDAMPPRHLRRWVVVIGVFAIVANLGIDAYTQWRSYQVTLEDPKIWTAPWTSDFIMKRHPTWSLLEFVCEENNRCLNGKCSENK